MFLSCFIFVAFTPQNDHDFVIHDMICACPRVQSVSTYVPLVVHHVGSKMTCRTRPYHTECAHSCHSYVHQFVCLTVFDRKSTPILSTITFQLLLLRGYVLLYTVNEDSKPRCSGEWGVHTTRTELACRSLTPSSSRFIRCHIMTTF
jgi:hypothetical protein